MSDRHFLTPEQCTEITSKFIGKLYKTYKKFVKHEAEYGFWLPEKYKADPGKWLELLRELEMGFDENVEYIKSKKETK